MPAIFGAFGNFLLPTQLGVHDVAFPRLNSAAFWFLPGGLIMLCQLVCVDRRYQRMNCFNIRELQGILKRKFFTDLINTSDSHKAIEPTIIGMRHKNNMSNILLYDQSLFYNFDITTTSKYKNYNFTPGKIYTYNKSITTPFNKGVLNNTLSNVYSFLSAKGGMNIVNTLKDFLNFFYMPTITTLINQISSIQYIQTVLANIFYVNINLSLPKSFYEHGELKNTPTNSNNYNSSTLNHLSFNKSSFYTFSENSSS
jgi:hypothetical protein